MKTTYSKNSIALNNLLKINLSTYYWSLYLWDVIYDNLKEELREASRDNWTLWYIKVEDEEDDIPINDIENDYEREDNKEERDFFLEFFEDRLKEFEPDFEKKFKKYGVKNIHFWYYKPMYYNYENDELSFWYEYDDKPIDESLKPYIQNYIDNILIRSYDWYCSFEPTNIDRVDKSDYSFIYAILDKENMIENIKKAINEALEDFYESHYELYRWFYQYNSKEYQLIRDYEKDLRYLKYVKTY